MSNSSPYAAGSDPRLTRGVHGSRGPDSLVRARGCRRLAILNAVPPKMKQADLSSDQMRLIRDRIAERRSRTDCISCGSPQVGILPRLVHYQLQNLAKVISNEVDEKYLIAAAMVCTNCGFVSTHVLGAGRLRRSNRRIGAVWLGLVGGYGRRNR